MCNENDCVFDEMKMTEVFFAKLYVFFSSFHKIVEGRYMGSFCTLELKISLVTIIIIMNSTVFSILCVVLLLGMFYLLPRRALM